MTAEVIESPEAELTEFEVIDVQKVSGVAQPANGTMHLIMKGLPVVPESEEVSKAGNPGCGCCGDCTMDDDASKAVVNGKVDQKPDISIGEKILGLLGQAMGNESQEVAAGHHGEAGDVHMLAQAHDIVHAWCNGEKTHPDGLKSEAADDDAAKAKLSAADRKNLPDSAFALPGRQYPIHDENHAHAALSEVAQHGTPEEQAKVKAAVRRRYPGIKVDGDSSKSVADVAEQETTVDDVTQGTEVVTKSDLEAAVTKALESHKAEIATLRDELAKVKALPQPGGPVISTYARPQGQTAERDDLSAKAALMRIKADMVTDPSEAAGYRQYARELDEKAKTTA